ncbi:MAG: alpha/beta hydrolase [Nocardiopsaceae bacterium]|jgi:pimeloyl-ACP methyl ester carboxylesterase|nr:alpha/beta hydrolase [Nocardiopsaceae bacterium]
MRARYPDSDGLVVRDGVEIRYERYGEGSPTILLLPTWSLVPSRHWKMQVPYLARHFSVLTFDGRGTGDSGRPAEPSAYTDAVFASDALAVMDAAGCDSAVLVSLSCGALWTLRLCAEHPDRVLGAVFIGPAVPLVPLLAERQVQRFDDVIDDPVGWQTYNAHYWKTDYPEFVRFFVGRIFTEQHSTKQIEDAIGWALETDGETLAAAHLGLGCCDEPATRRLTAKVSCPVLVMHGTDDALRGYAEGEALADSTGGDLITLEGSGHFPHTRDPVRVNMLIKQFADRIGR